MANTTHYGAMAKARETVILVGTFTTAGTGVPTAATGDISSVARTAAGAYTVTLRHSYPQCDYADASHRGADPTLDAKVVSAANVSTGSLTVASYTEDATTGISAAADTTGKVIQILLVVRNTSVTAR